MLPARRGECPLALTSLSSCQGMARAIMPVVEEFESLSEKLARVTAECERLRVENERLRRTLATPNSVQKRNSRYE